MNKFDKKGSSFNRKLNEILTPNEKILYRKILKDIANNDEFYSVSSPEEITSHLVETCNFDRASIYRLFRKITSIDEG